MSEQKQRSWWSRNWKWVVPVGCGTPILACGGFASLIVLLVFSVIKSTAPYTESLAAVKASPQAQQELGAPIEPGFWIAGNVETSGASGHADISYAVSGPSGAGKVFAQANKSTGEWMFTKLVLEIHNTGERIDLLAHQ